MLSIFLLLSDYIGGFIPLGAHIIVRTVHIFFALSIAP
jgi:hypothetical protein